MRVKDDTGSLRYKHKFLFPEFFGSSVGKFNSNHRVRWKSLTAAAIVFEVENLSSHANKVFVERIIFVWIVENRDFIIYSKWRSINIEKSSVGRKNIARDVPIQFCDGHV